jgi:hypothetical protein
MSVRLRPSNVPTPDAYEHRQRTLHKRTSDLPDQKWLRRKAKRKMALESRRRNRRRVRP